MTNTRVRSFDNTNRVMSFGITRQSTIGSASVTHKVKRQRIAH